MLYAPNRILQGPNQCLLNEFINSRENEAQLHRAIWTNLRNTTVEWTKQDTVNSVLNETIFKKLTKTLLCLN